MKTSNLLLSACCALALVGCASDQPDGRDLSRWSFHPEMVVPADRSLSRPEDGVFVNGGDLIVADQEHGLRLLRADGSSRPFGRLPHAGYQHRPPAIVGGPNGVSLEPSGTHLLVCDVFRGGIYRVEIASEQTEKVYQHRFGVNTACADSSGGIWFTQSTRNNPNNGEEELFKSVDHPTPDGELFYLSRRSAGARRSAVSVSGGFEFANGIAIDEANGHLYLAETMGSRLWRFRLDIAAGRVSDRTLVLEIDHPDNLEFDRFNRLWIASPIKSQVFVFDPKTNSARSVIRVETAESNRLVETIESRIAKGESWIDLMIPGLWEPAPGLITGIILPPGDGPIHLTGLGTALIRLPR